MKTTILTLLLSIIVIEEVHTQNYCIRNRFSEQEYFKEKDIAFDESGVYGYAVDWKGNMDTLHFSIAFPKSTEETLEKRPFIMLIHGGGFYKETREQQYQLAARLALRGFVVASIDYRLGWDWKPEKVTIPGKLIGDKYYIQEGLDSTLQLAIYRAVQDAHASLRYFVKNADKYGIDTNWIFIGGSSAGSTTSSCLAFMSQADFDDVVPFCRKALGKIESSTNEIEAHFRIKGVIEMWGGMGDTSWISEKEAHNTAVIAYHGSKDYGLTYDQRAGTPENYKHVSHGGYSIAARFRQFNACHQLNIKIGAGHGEFTKDYLAKQTACFFRSLFCNACVSIEQESENENLSCDEKY